MNQRGFSESTQWAVLTPVALLLVLGLVQVGVWLHARTVAGQAAAAVADLSASGSPDAAAAGRRIASSAGLEKVTITTKLTPELVQVTLTARAPVFFDIGQGVISETAVMPREAVR